MVPIRLLSTLALSGVLDVLLPRLSAGLPPVETQLAPTNVLLERIAAGARGDIAILTDTAVDDLSASGVLDGASRVTLARSHVGLAVRQGAMRPDISTAAAVAAALSGARSVALSRTGASGVFMTGLLVRLGIADEVNRKATVISSGLTGERIVSGAADLAVQQMSELMAVPGLDILGRLPPEIEGVSVFTAALFTGAVPGAADVVAALRTAT
ncbi:MAG: substrate-binding domain-containing protein, partial [Janthinobacterium lividum]